jgi:hypothetical protein
VLCITSPHFATSKSRPVFLNLNLDCHLENIGASGGIRPVSWLGPHSMHCIHCTARSGQTRGGLTDGNNAVRRYRQATDMATAVMMRGYAGTVPGRKPHHLHTTDIYASTAS